jgi:predicted naringenin-chalcone synthase
MSTIRSIGLALPPNAITQQQASALTASLSRAGDEDARFIHAIHKRSGVERRWSVVADAPDTAGTSDANSVPQTFYTGTTSGGPSTAARMLRYSFEAAPLALRAARESLGRANIPADRITHLVTASCTGFDSPGVDAALIDSLGLSRAVQRTHVGFMGCHAAINALRVCDAMTRAGGTALLVCVELCTLHLRDEVRPDRVVANALFGDGAGAAVVVPDAPGLSGWRVVSTASFLLPETRDAMAWRIGDHGFEMSLAERVPAIIREHLGQWACDWLGAHDVASDTLASIGWAIHPGGPRILDAARDALAIPELCLADSRSILREHGNMSSPTVLFILDRISRDPIRSWAVLLAFGPGLTIEGALLKRV